MQGLLLPLYIVIVGVVSSPAYGALDIDSLNKKLKQKQLGWHAGTTTAFRNSEARPNVMSIADDEVLQDAGDDPIILGAYSADPSLPSRFDWRDINGKSFVAPVGDQGDCGACVAFAATSTLETQLNIARSTPYSPWKLSRQYVFSCGGGVCGKGWLLTKVVPFLVDNGAPDAACLEYTSGSSGKDVPCRLACNNADDRSEKIIGFERPTRGWVNVEKIKRAILMGPLLSSMILFEDFEAYKGGVYRHTEGNQRGTHAVVLIGWDDAKQAWIGRNSMGKDWGESGDFYIAWNDKSLIGRYTYRFDVRGSEFVAFGNVRTGDTLTGDAPLRIHSSFAGTNRVSVYAVRDQNDIFDSSPVFQKLDVNLSPSESTDTTYNMEVSSGVTVRPILKTKTLTNGVYYIYTQADHDSGQGFSAPVKINIQN